MTDPYAPIAALYEPLLGPLLAPIRRQAVELLKHAKPGRVLDLGCGTGVLACDVAQLGVNVAGVDESPAMLQKAQNRAEKLRVNIDFRLGPAQKLPWPDKHFDVAVASLLFHELNPEDRLPVLHESLRVAQSLLVFDYIGFGDDPLHKIARACLHIPERLAGKRHYNAFQHFMQRQGLRKFLVENHMILFDFRPAFFRSLCWIWTKHASDWRHPIPIKRPRPAA